MQQWCHKKHYLGQEKVRQINSQFNGNTIRRYSTTLLFVGSMAFSIHLHALDGTHDHAIKQSMIAEFALAQGDIATAIEHYTTLAVQHSSTSVKERALNIALEHEELHSALDIATYWVKQEPKDVPALFYLSHIALKTHEYDLAARTLDHILGLDPNSDLEQILAGIAPEASQDRDVLIQALKTSQEKNNPSILVLVASLEAQNGLFEQALKTIESALKKRPQNTGFILLKGNLLDLLGDQKAALKWYQTVSKKQSTNLEVHLAEAKYLIKINQAEKALDKLEKIIMQWPQAEEALFIAGLNSIDLEHYEKAERYLVQLRSSAQYQNDAYYYLAINADRKQHYATAKAYYRLVDGNLYMVSRRHIINIFQKQNQLNDALRFLTQERVNYPQYASFLYQAQAELLKQLQNKPAAIVLLDAAIRQIPDDPELIYSEVLLLDPYQDRDKLDQRLKQLLHIEPNSPTYLNAYAYTLALQNRRLDEARQYVEQALLLEPNQASILDTFGYIAYLQNDFSKASQALAQAYKLTGSLKIGIRYARALYMQGEIQQFAQLLEQLQHKYPNDPLLEPLHSLLLPSTSHKS